MKTSSSWSPTTPTKQKTTLSVQTYLIKHLKSYLSISPLSTRLLTTPSSKLSLVRDLGVQLSSDYSWTPNINIMVDAAWRTTSWVLTVFSDRSPETMMTLYKSLIRSRLEYCCPLWNPHLIRDIQQIESVRRTFTSKIQSCRHLDYHERLKHLCLFSLQRRRERYIIIHMWKVLHDLSPNDLDISFGESGRVGIKAKLPALTRKCKTSAKSLYDSLLL